MWVGWVERSETHQLPSHLARWVSLALNPSYDASHSDHPREIAPQLLRLGGAVPGLEFLLRLAPARRRRPGALLAGRRDAHHAGALVLARRDGDQLVARERLHGAGRGGAVHHPHLGERADRPRTGPDQLGGGPAL